MTDPHCRLRKIKAKRKSRYRSPSAFNITTAKLMRAVSLGDRQREGRGL